MTEITADALAKGFAEITREMRPAHIKHACSKCGSENVSAYYVPARDDRGWVGMDDPSWNNDREHLKYHCQWGVSMDTRVLLAKNRHGPGAIMPVRWDFTTLKLEERAPTLEESSAIHGIRTKSAS